jgi:RNA polymerase sigma factor (sigma-70 family)
MTVHAALTGLSPDCREILDRFFTRDESYRTIGAELDLPAGTIASRIARCLARLRDVLQPDTVPVPGRKPTAHASGE